VRLIPSLLLLFGLNNPFGNVNYHGHNSINRITTFLINLIITY